jgi:uncharacterized membrane protein YgdD (TMEM256/DUF423 family)
MKIWIMASAVNGFIAVTMGAAGAHWLREVVSESSIDLIKLSSQYQLIHALALIAGAILQTMFRTRSLQIACSAFFAGTLLFCGGLYIFALPGLQAATAFVPLCGMSFLVGWAALLWFALRRPAPA